MAPSSQASCRNCGCFNPSEPLTQSHWSRLEFQLRENQSLSDIEKQTVAKVEQDIEGYDREITRMKLAIISLQYKRDLAKDYVSRHKSLLAPIRRIPNDVLIEIFERCSAEIAIGHFWICLPQFRLSQVCSHWRSVVNASPMLWSTFWVELEQPTPVGAHFSDTILMNIVDIFLTKSGDHSLTLDLAQFGGGDIHPVLRLLLNHSHRWMDATLELESSLLEQVYPACTGFARLRHLNTAAGAMFVAPAAPRLQSLSLNLNDTVFLASNQDFPWSQLREIKLLSTTTAQCTDIFSWCKQLQYASLICGTPGSSDQLITSTTVVSLTLTDWEEEGIEDFLRLAQFPQLHTLELVDCPFSLASAYPFVSRSPVITTLSLRESVFDFGDIPELLRLLPTVISFQWCQSWSRVLSETVDNLFSKLHPYSSDSRTLLPRLKHFDIRLGNVADDKDFNVVSSFVNMVQARWVEKPENERLKSVQLSFPKTCLNHDLIHPLRYLQEDGMAISVQDKCGFLL